MDFDPNFYNALRYEINKLEDRLDHIETLSIPFSATPTIDLSRLPHVGTIDFGTLTANVTAITLSNPGKGQKWTIIFTQNGVGNFTVAGWPATVKLTGAAFTVTVTAAAKSVITFVFDGTNHIEVARSLDVR